MLIEIDPRVDVVFKNLFGSTEHPRLLAPGATIVYTSKCALGGASMEVTTKELRIQPGKILEQVSIGQEVTITYRGKPLAKLIPFRKYHSDEGSSMFGLWKDRDTELPVDDYVRTLRKGREF